MADTKAPVKPAAAKPAAAKLAPAKTVAAKPAPGDKPAKKASKPKPRNYDLGNGVYRFSRTRMFHKKAIYKFLNKKTPKTVSREIYHFSFRFDFKVIFLQIFCRRKKCKFD